MFIRCGTKAEHGIGYRRVPYRKGNIQRLIGYSCFIDTYGAKKKDSISFQFFTIDHCLLFLFSFVQHCFLCRPLGPTVPKEAGIEPWTVATLASAAGRSNHFVFDIIIPKERKNNYRNSDFTQTKGCQR